MGAFDSTLGAFLIGVLASGCLWGVSCAQLWHYYHHYPDDSVWLKTLVSAVFASDTVHQVLITYGLYFYMVTHYGDVDLLNVSTAAIAIQTGVQGLTAFLVQGFFVYRIYKLSGRNKFVAAAVSVLVVVQFALIIVNTVRNYEARTYETTGNRVTTAVAVAITVFTDLVIAGILCWLLRAGRAALEKDEIVAHANSVVRRLMIFSMSTGLLTSLWVLGFFIAYLAAPDTYVYMALFFVAGRLYVNSLLVALNVRGTMRKLWRGVGSGSGPGGGQRRSYTVHLDSRHSAPGVSPTDAIALKAFAIRGPPPPRVDVHVDVDVERGMSAESEEAPLEVTAM